MNWLTITQIAVLVFQIGFAVFMSLDVKRDYKFHRDYLLKKYRELPDGYLEWLLKQEDVDEEKEAHKINYQTTKPTTMNLAITRQRNLMQQAIRYYEDIVAIKRHFDYTDSLVNLKIEQLQQRYAETVTELAKLLMEPATRDLQAYADYVARKLAKHEPPMTYDAYK